MNKHQNQFNNRILSLETVAAPHPWVKLSDMAVGGLHSIGFSEDLSYLLLVSSSGRGLVAASSGELIERDPTDDNSFISNNYETALGIGPLEGQAVKLSGIWGGGLLTMTEDGWSITVAPKSPDERIILQAPGTGIFMSSNLEGCFQISKPVTEIRAVGFSPNGKTLLVATSSDLLLWGRN